MSVTSAGEAGEALVRRPWGPQYNCQLHWPVTFSSVSRTHSSQAGMEDGRGGVSQIVFTRWEAASL